MDLAPFRDFLAFGATMLGLMLAALMAVSAIFNGDHRRVKAAALALPLAAMSTSPAAAASPSLIIPGKRIGPAALGMSPSELSRAVSAIPCPEDFAVEARFHADRVIQIYTRCGGVLSTPGGAQPGAMLATAPDEFGPPDTVIPGKTSRLPTGHVAVTAWHVYRAGIAFRTVRLSDDPEWGATITCVSVFMPAVRPVLGDRCRP
jgi:hypothetical protein